MCRGESVSISSGRKEGRTENISLLLRGGSVYDIRLQSGHWGRSFIAIPDHFIYPPDVIGIDGLHNRFCIFEHGGFECLFEILSGQAEALV